MTGGAKPQPCCMPAAPGGQHSEVPAFRPGTATRPVHGEMVALPGGEFLMGSDATEGFPADGEGPARRVRIVPFRIDAHAVSNAKFATFVAETGYRTEAEALGWSYVFSGFLPAALKLRRSTTTAAIASAFAVAMLADPNGRDRTRRRTRLVSRLGRRRVRGHPPRQRRGSGSGGGQ
ncbi:SUMF1/EgtB/PvdO family nonheme iron enzyme [Nocardia fusca]|uniref:SUMF1/EgtB/PvdO family nonheme iron enzyme n=1 Tax=Nocardia fusca TaxID=941183 RepID=UPI0037C6E008